jgi:uncharacterized protein (DUF433 family)
MGKNQKINSPEPRIGEGIFLPKDVAEILKLPYSRVKYWIDDYWQSYSFGERRNKAVNFYTLIEFYTFYKLREQGFSAQEIKKAHEIISEDLKTHFPFAYAVIKTQRNQIWYESLGVLIRADKKQQISIKNFVEPFLQQIEFGENNLAKRLFPLKSSKNIVVDPDHQFGLPTISGTNIQTKTILNLYESGESKESIRILYGISDPQIIDALQFYKKMVA